MDEINRGGALNNQLTEILQALSILLITIHFLASCSSEQKNNEAHSSRASTDITAFIQNNADNSKDYEGSPVIIDGNGIDHESDYTDSPRTQNPILNQSPAATSEDQNTSSSNDGDQLGDQDLNLPNGSDLDPSNADPSKTTLSTNNDAHCETGTFYNSTKNTCIAEPTQEECVEKEADLVEGECQRSALSCNKAGKVYNQQINRCTPCFAGQEIVENKCIFTESSCLEISKEFDKGLLKCAETNLSCSNKGKELNNGACLATKESCAFSFDREVETTEGRSRCKDNFNYCASIGLDFNGSNCVADLNHCRNSAAKEGKPYLIAGNLCAEAPELSLIGCALNELHYSETQGKCVEIQEENCFLDGMRLHDDGNSCIALDEAYCQSLQPPLIYDEEKMACALSEKDLCAQNGKIWMEDGYDWIEKGCYTEIERNSKCHYDPNVMKQYTPFSNQYPKFKILNQDTLECKEFASQLILNLHFDVVFYVAYQTSNGPKEHVLNTVMGPEYETILVPKGHRLCWKQKNIRVDALDISEDFYIQDVNGAKIADHQLSFGSGVLGAAGGTIIIDASVLHISPNYADRSTWTPFTGGSGYLKSFSILNKDEWYQDCKNP